MISESCNQPIGLLLSGGLDSGILLGHLLQQGHRVRPFYVRSGLVWERAEMAALRRLLRACACERLDELVVLELPLDDLYGGHWSITGRGTPAAESPDSAVYLPGRNALLIVKAAIWCRLHGIEQLALAVLASNPFADATDEFFAGFESVLNRAVDGRLRIVRPFARLDKRQVMQLGVGQPLELTFSCISPIDEAHCGRCNKCAERQAAFDLIGQPDPTEYGRMQNVE
ncbi:MAG: 7-cyano-7-deazaguanine synthase [Candidatus Nealsonbacteria bacterium]|nr:7-cyano-7-deazaguanine synthase [Candidatus Nealsonbacteria bacterium]